ncbi:MAG: PAS domain S-box protein, partial [Burkholderiaceae bacterium]
MIDLLTDPRALGRLQARALLGLVLANVLVAALLVLLATLSLRGSQDALRQRAQMATENLAGNLQRTIAAELGQVEMALQTLSVASDGRLFSPASRVALLAQLREAAPQIRALRIIEAADLQRPGAPPLAADEAAAWRELGAGGTAGAAGDVFLGEPVPARPGHEAHIGMARRLAPAGSDGIRGIVYAEIAIASLQQTLAEFELGRHGAVSLRHQSLALIARRASGEASPAQVGTRGVSPQLADALRASPREGRFDARSALDGIERSNSYKLLARYPLLVIAGTGTADYLRPWYQQRAQIAALLLFVMLLVACMSWLLFSAWRKESDAGRRLRVEARRNRLLLRTASDGIHVLDRQGRVVELSDSFATMLGRSHDELLGQAVSSWDAQLDPQELLSAIAGFAVGERRQFETRHRRADGALIDVEVSCASVRIDGRELIYCSARDISEHKRLERRLLASAEQIRDLYDQAPCGYHSLDAQGRYLHVNGTELSWLGCTREELVGKRHLWEFLTPAGRALFQAQFPLMLAGGRVDGLELELLPEHGPRRWVSISATALRDDQGRFLMTRSVLYDSSELHRAREQLQAVLHEQALMLDNDLIGIVKLRGTEIVWSNQAISRIFGYEPQQLLGRPLSVLYPDDESYRQLQEESAAVLRSGGRYRRQVHARRKDGRLVWIDVKGALLSAPAAGPQRDSIWMLADITPLKESQQKAEYMAFHDALTGLPNRLLLHDRLQQSLALAEREKRMVALCYLDLDGFKQINDRLGHAAGDELLQIVGQRLLSAVRANDSVCRLGGDEFV